MTVQAVSTVSLNVRNDTDREGARCLENVFQKWHTIAATAVLSTPATRGVFLFLFVSSASADLGHKNPNRYR